MELKHSFTIPAPVEDAWSALVDIERVAPCMPGAALDSVEGDSFTGRVKVKLGPVNLTYSGQASFVERDPAARRAVIDARGKDQRGNGTASARISAVLAEAEGAGTRVDVVTDLNITGRPAQFGRAVMADVGDRLLSEFAGRLADELASGSAPAPLEAVDGGPIEREPAGEPPAIDLFQLAGGSTVVRRFAAVAAGLSAVVVVVLLIWRGRRR